MLDAPAPPGFGHVRTWVFDLDNTLYPPSARLFDQIERRMTDFVARAVGVGRAEADRLRRLWWARHGTTLAGLMAEHGVDPGPYLREVHEIDLSPLTPDPALAARIRALPGRRVVHTNGPRVHAERVLAARGLEGLFDAIFGIEDTGFVPKPRPEAFEAVFAAGAIAPERGAMFEDDARNLAVPAARGMVTVHVAAADHDPGHGAEPPAASTPAHHRTDDLAAFLGRVLAALERGAEVPA